MGENEFKAVQFLRRILNTIGVRVSFDLCKGSAWITLWCNYLRRMDIMWRNLAHILQPRGVYVPYCMEFERVGGGFAAQGGLQAVACNL